MNTLSKILGVVMAAALMISSAAQATSIGINFVGGEGAVNTPASLDPTDVAGVIPQDNWNNASGNSSSLSDLLDDNGAATTATSHGVPTVCGESD